MKIGLVDADNKDVYSTKTFPNLPLMKLSAYHKRIGDDVEWWKPDADKYDLVYVSKVFSFSEDPSYRIQNALRIVKGGSGFAIKTVDGLEVYDKTLDGKLPDEIEHIYPDYDLYGIKDTAYGFLQRGCPRGCGFCHVKSMQGTAANKVADLNEFWNGQSRIVLLDPNITACRDWKDLLQQLIESKAEVDFSQGVDIRTLTEEKVEMLRKIKIKNIHFAWDRYQDGEFIKPKLKMFRDISGWSRNKISVYVLTNFDTTFEQDLERVMFIRSLNFQPYVMRYNKQSIPRGSDANGLARWANFPALFWRYENYEDYKRFNRIDKKRKGETTRDGEVQQLCFF